MARNVQITNVRLETGTDTIHITGTVDGVALVATGSKAAFDAQLTALAKSIYCGKQLVAEAPPALVDLNISATLTI